MADRSFSLALTRWHHVADRIRAFGDSKLSEALGALGATTARHQLSDEQVAQLKERGEKALAAIATAQNAVATVGLIREKLADANAQQGVTAMLAQAESLRKQAQLLRKVAAIDLVTKTPLDRVNAVLAERTKENDMFSDRTGVAVALVAGARVDGFADRAMELESQAAAIADQVADLNRHTITIAISEELAAAAGLK